MSVAIILCGGLGERIHSSKQLAKTLIALDGQCLLDFILAQTMLLQVNRIVIVTNSDNYALICRHIHTEKAIHIYQNIAVDIFIAENASLGNGITLFEGIKKTQEDFFVLMSDHIIEKKAIQLFKEGIQHARAEIALLACDLDTQNIFDIEDATKVYLEDNRIIHIGKNLKQYNAIDMGLFFFPYSYRNIIEQSIMHGAYTLTEIVQFILDRSPFEGVSMQDIKWQDIDTPAMLIEAMKQFSSPETLLP